MAANSPDIVDMRLSGDERTVAGLADAFTRMPGIEVLRTSGPRANRHDTGVRVYMVVRVKEEQ